MKKNKLKSKTYYVADLGRRLGTRIAESAC